MADETTGKLSKKQWYIITGFGAAYVGYRWYESRKASSTSGTSATTGTSTPGDMVGTDANGNPVYLNSAGQEVDANGNPDTVATLGTSSLGEGYVNPSPITETTATSNEPSTDEAWTAAVETDLENLGYDPQTVATAIAQYLASQPLTASQVTIIRTAWAYEGRPPGEPNLPIIQAGSTTTTGGGTNPTVTALTPGQIVQVPVALQGGTTWQSTAAKAGESVQHLQQNNPGVSGTSGVVINVPVLVTSSGRNATWQSIASYWGISVGHLQSNNPSIDQTAGTTGSGGTAITSTT
jgi:hypothetical protein